MNQTSIPHEDFRAMRADPLPRAVTARERRGASARPRLVLLLEPDGK